MLGVIAVLLTRRWNGPRLCWGKASQTTRSLPLRSVAHCPKVSSYSYMPAYNSPPESRSHRSAPTPWRRPHHPTESSWSDGSTTPVPSTQPVERIAASSVRGVSNSFSRQRAVGFKAGALELRARAYRPRCPCRRGSTGDYDRRTGCMRSVPAFADQKLAIAQSRRMPRDAEENAFKAMCYAEYRGFFHIGIVVRNERNAIIQHGTDDAGATLGPQAVNGWAQWCITEDAEHGATVRACFTKRSTRPSPTVTGSCRKPSSTHKKQRFRWAYGAVNPARACQGIVERRPAPQSQRYHFIAGWLPSAGRRLAVLVFNVRTDLVGGHDHCASSPRSAVDDVLFRCRWACLRSRWRSSRTALCVARGSEHSPDDGGGLGWIGLSPAVSVAVSGIADPPNRSPRTPNEQAA